MDVSGGNRLYFERSIDQGRVKRKEEGEQGMKANLPIYPKSRQHRQQRKQSPSSLSQDSVELSFVTTVGATLSSRLCTQAEPVMSRPISQSSE